MARPGQSTPADCSFPGENARSWEALGEARPSQNSHKELTPVVVEADKSKIFMMAGRLMTLEALQFDRKAVS